MMAGLISGQGNARAAFRDRGDDLYETPLEAINSLLAVEALPKLIWEPACGRGAIAKPLREAGHEVIATDLIDYEWLGQNKSRMDFLMQIKPPKVLTGFGPNCNLLSTTPKCIVTNPPFKLAGEFVTKALDLCPKVIMLLRLAFMESERRTPILDNGRLARVHVYRKRLPMMHRAGWKGRKANSGMAFAWFVWDREHNGPTELHRISWETP